MYEEATELFRSLKARKTDAISRECPAGIDWVSVASGVVEHEEALHLLEHAALCPHCGPSLQSAVEQLSDKTTPEEESILTNLRSGFAAGQADLAERLRECSAQAAVPLRPRKPLVLWARFAIAAAAMLLVAAGVEMGRRHWKTPSPESLIADAYTEDRTLELRVPGAAYAPIKVQRGASSSNLDRPGALLRAESMIKEGLRRNPNDAALLGAEARADLLDNNYQHAIELSQRALETDPQSIPRMLDLSTAYFQRGEENGNDQHDYALAIEYLSRMLAITPDDTVALYNRAVAEQRAMLYDLAAADWKRFLEIERDSKWRADGKRQQDLLLQSIQRSKQSSAVPDRDPSRATGLLLAHADRETYVDWPRSRDEFYIDLALTDWLSAIASTDGALASDAPKTLRELDALNALGRMLHRRHGDGWLSDLLAEPHSKLWFDGVHELSFAARANAAGDPAQGVVHAEQALRRFLRSGSRAGRAAAAFELARGVDHSQRGDRCLSAGQEGLREADQRYPWMRTKVFYELSTCSTLLRNSEQAEHFAQRGEETSRDADYPVLALQGKFFLDGVSSPQVADAESWNRIRSGLKEFWNSEYPPVCAGEFFVDLEFAAKTEHLWRFAEAAAEEALLMHSQAEDHVVVAAAHASLAQAALAAGDSDLADREFGKASDLLRAWGRDSRAAYATLEIQRASSEVRHGSLKRAQTRLAEVESVFSNVSDSSTSILYRETLGELYLRSGRSQLAEKELLAAVRMIEASKSLVSSENELLTWQLDQAQTYRLLLELYSGNKNDEARSLAFLEWFRIQPLRIDARSALRLHRHPLGQSEFPDLSRAKFEGLLSGLSATTPSIVWASFPNEVVIWEIDRTGVHRARTTIGEDVLHATAARFTRLCADPLSDKEALNRDAHLLYSWLIEPVSMWLPRSGRLNVEADLSLRSIPFQALEGDTGLYLGERFSISESAGLLYPLVLRPETGFAADATVLAIGDPFQGATPHGERLMRLPDADREAQEVAAFFPKHHVLLGRDATLSNFEMLLPHSDVFHFAGHALVRGSASGLLLASKDRGDREIALLGQHQLRPRDMGHLRLAVLASCDTAFADQGMFDPGSLVRIFLRSGVHNVVASKWRVDSHVSEETMKQFYAQLVQGHSTATALADSERAIRSNPETAHPYFWASFSSFGG